MSVAEVLQVVVALGLPILAFEYTRRRGAPTRRDLVIASAVGGGVSGAILAIVAAAGGSSFENTLPFAVFNLGLGAAIGLIALAARSLGEWLSRGP
jgi:hypothetical protein